MSGGHDAVEQVDAARDCGDQVLGKTQAHQVARRGRGERGQGGREQGIALARRLADAEPADRERAEAERGRARGALGAQHRRAAALHDPEQELIRAPVRARPRSAQRSVRSRHARVRPWSGSPGGSPRTRPARRSDRRRASPGSRPRARATGTPSGRREALELDALSLRRQNASSENTWKPPESVSIGPSQPMNACSRRARRPAPRPGAGAGGRCSRAPCTPTRASPSGASRAPSRTSRPGRTRASRARRGREQSAAARRAVAGAGLSGVSGSTARPRRSRSGSPLDRVRVGAPVASTPANAMTSASRVEPAGGSS